MYWGYPMTIDANRLQKLLHEHLCKDVKFVTRPYDGALILDTKFAFPDGDRYLIHVADSPTGEGNIRLSDRGETLMHMSYVHDDIDFFYNGVQGELLEQIMGETGLKWNETGGAICLDTTPENLSEAVFQFGLGLTRIYDMTLLSEFNAITEYYNKSNETISSRADNSVDERQPDKSNVIDFNIHATFEHISETMQQKKIG